MENKAALPKPQQPTIQPPPPCAGASDFDPFSNAKPCSPFYLYNHDSPRASTDVKSKPSFNISTHDLESGSLTLTPSITQEKMDRQTTAQSMGGWRGKVLSKQCSKMCQPKGKNWLKRMPKKQQLLVKFLIAFVVIGIMIGLAVGIAVHLRSGVWKSNNQQSNIQ